VLYHKIINQTCQWPFDQMLPPRMGVVWGQEFNCYDVHELLTTRKTFLWTKHEDVVRVV
jgi:hypothetical protein